ncbi:MAG TPA: bifunctional phosphoglucose/phosphomannose isomerase [Candidatus Saccharimonadales bacterium]|nr:bifunctional phosphoglucose/phosphomannose isomerase [Candidatus Saccharimonadales bacterium]
MLDDLKMIHSRDAQDALGIAERQWQQLQQTYDVGLPELGNITTVVVGGMGGSALAAAILQSWPQLSVPFEIVRNYNLPQYVNEQTLFIASSYSGNTEETLSALDEAEQRGCKIVVVASGGKLEERAAEKNYPFYELATGYQPRHAVFYNLAALVQLFEALGFIAGGSQNELHQAAEWLKEQTNTWLPTAATQANRAKQIALDVIGKSAVVYSGPKLWPAAYKWKISFNENAKHIAWANQYPEFNHNEMMGWTEQPVDKPYAVIDLRSNLEHPRVQKRMEVAERLLSGRRPAPIVVEAQGETLLQQLLWTITLGDFVSLYTALANGINPSPVDLIEKFKKSLDE